MLRTQLVYTETVRNPPYGSPKAVTVSSTIINDDTGASGEVESADGAIGITAGQAIITKGSAATLTLAAPTVTTDDYKILRIEDTTGFAHTVTTPANKINGSLHIVTFDANKGSFIELLAYQGVWYTMGMLGVETS